MKVKLEESEIEEITKVTREEVRRIFDKVLKEVESEPKKLPSNVKCIKKNKFLFKEEEINEKLNKILDIIKESDIPLDVGEINYRLGIENNKAKSRTNYYLSKLEKNGIISKELKKDGRKTYNIWSLK